MIIGDLSIWDEVAFKRKSRQLHQLSLGDYRPIADELAIAFPRTSLPTRAIPFVQRYVAELGGQYARPPVRRFSAASMAQPVWQKLQAVYDASRIDRALEAVESILWTQNTALLLVLPDGFGKVRLQPLYPWQINEIVTDDALRADDPAYWSKLDVQVPISAVAGQVILGRMVLTRDSASRTIGGAEVGVYSPDKSHPFGRIPVVVAHRIAPDAGRSLAPVNESVLNLQIALSLQQADNELIVRSAAWPQRWIRNADTKQLVEELAIGPDKFLALVRGGDPQAPAPELAVAQGQVPVGELVSFAEHQIRLYCSMLGLDPGVFLRSNTGASSEARLFASQDRKALRDRIQPCLLQMEKDLLALIAAVLSLREPMPIPSDLSVSVTWFDDSPSANRQSDAQALQAEVALGIASPADVVAARDGVDRATAARTVEKNLKDNRALGLVADLVAAPVADAKPAAVSPSAAAAEVVPTDAAAVADTAMNGAQVASLVEIIQAVSAGTMPAEAAKQIIASAFPTLSQEAIDKMVQSADTFTPATPADGAANA